jgi:hypothetical protein
MFIGAPPALVRPGRDGRGLARFFPNAIYDDRLAVSKGLHRNRQQPLASHTRRSGKSAGDSLLQHLPGFTEFN